jgi:tetratricopeptide (TPR) repeat protein
MFAALLAVTLVAYYPAWYGGPLWDDDAHLTTAALRGPGGLWRIWFELGATQQYYPLLHSTFWLLDRAWGTANTLPYHLLNIGLHASSAFLLFCILRQLVVPGAAIAAVIFALHPVHVESVAWMTELKNTLSGVFYFSAALLYLAFDRGRQRRFYLLALVCFVLGLLSKTVVASLPAALLVVFWWRRGTLGWTREVRPLLPFVAIGIAAGLLTAWVERHFIGAAGAAFELDALERCLLASRAAWFYLGKLLWPMNLMFIYPRWQISSEDATAYLYLAGVVIALAAGWMIRSRTRAPLAAALLFGGTLMPALGFVNVFPFRYSYVADHFQYLASVAPISLAAAGIALVLRESRARNLVPVGLVVPLAVLTWQQSSIYRDAQTLYSATLARNPECWMCHNNLAALIAGDSARTEEALAHLEQSLQINRLNEEAFNNRGVLLGRQGKHEQSIADLREAVRLSPNYADAHLNLAVALQTARHFEDAVTHYRHVLRLRPASADGHDGIGAALLATGAAADARHHLEIAARLRPGRAATHNNLGTALSHEGRFTEALREFERAAGLAPEDAIVRRNLASALSELGRADDAISAYRESLRLDPRDPMTHTGLADLLVRVGRRQDAATYLERALRLDEHYAPAHLLVGNLLTESGRPTHALVSFQHALDGSPRVDRAQVLSNMGVACVMLGQHERAIALFEQAVALRPNFEQARANLDRARMEVRRR